MTEIIPSINALTFAGVQARIVMVEPYVSWCHVDVTDGVFSKHETWHDPADLSRLETKLHVEVHLMVENPEEVIDQWLVEPIRRVIVHLEAARDPELIIKKCRGAGREVGFAVQPRTSWELLKPWFEKVDMVCMLRVPPGASGQQMSSEMLGEIASVRAECPKCIIEVDGGVNKETAARAGQAGADILVAGAAIFNEPDIEDAIANLIRDHSEILLAARFHNFKRKR